MAWFPGAIRKIVARHDTPMDWYRGVCKHIAVSEGASLFNYFNQPGNPTSHFYVRYDGTVEQYVNTAFQAPANLQGNPTLISIETQGGRVAGQVWTAAQREMLAQIDAWCHQVHHIPLVAMPNSRPSSRGIGYHRQGVDPYRVDGGELWSKAYGKTCPESQRIAQIPGIITRANQILQPPTNGDGTMAWTDAQIAENLATLNEIASMLRTHAVRMDSLVNQQFPRLVTDVEQLEVDVAAIKQTSGATLGVDVKATRQNTAAAAGMLETIKADIARIAGPEEPPVEPPKA